MATPQTQPESSLARRCALQDCATYTSPDGERIVLALECPDGSIDHVALDERDARRLLERIAFHLRDDKSPPKVAYGSRSWYSRHSINRAAAAIGYDEEGAVERAKRQMSDVWDFAEEELDVLRRLLARKGSTAAKPATIVARVRRCVVTVIEAMRTDR